MKLKIEQNFERQDEVSNLINNLKIVTDSLLSCLKLWDNEEKIKNLEYSQSTIIVYLIEKYLDLDNSWLKNYSEYFKRKIINEFWITEQDYEEIKKYIEKSCINTKDWEFCDYRDKYPEMCKYCQIRIKSILKDANNRNMLHL